MQVDNVSMSINSPKHSLTLKDNEIQSLLSAEIQEPDLQCHTFLNGIAFIVFAAVHQALYPKKSLDHTCQSLPMPLQKFFVAGLPKLSQTGLQAKVIMDDRWCFMDITGMAERRD
jgi:hypothetical protein